MIERIAVLRATPSSCVAARRAIAADPATPDALARALRSRFAEAAIVATCERFEAVVVPHAGDDSSDAGLPEPLREAGWLVGRAAIRHVLRTAAGLESRIAGETHILGQVAAAARRAAAIGTSGPTLRHLFERAARVGRRVRSETDLGRLASSYVTLAAERVAACVAAGGAPALVGVVGSGALAAELVTALGERGVVSVRVFARHVERARAAIADSSATFSLLAELPEHVTTLDALVTATSSPRAIIDAAMLAHARRLRLVVDLGAPSNVADDVAAIAAIELRRLADLAGPTHAASTIAAAEAIVEAELDRLARQAATRTIVLAAHGARDGSVANRRVERLAAELATRDDTARVEAAFHLGTPSLAKVLARTRTPHVTVIPILASDGYFAREALPSVLRDAAPDGIELRRTPPVGTLPSLVSAFVRRVVSAVALRGRDCRVIVVGHGTARSSTSGLAAGAIARELSERLPGVAVSPAYLDQSPLLDDVARSASERTLVIAPALIGGGDHELVDLRARSERATVDVVLLPSLGEAPELADAVASLAAWYAPDRFIRLGTRASRLARIQADMAATALASIGCRTQIVEMTTHGDRDQRTPIDEFDVDGPFTDDLDRALVDGSIDIAVHSLKDLPHASRHGTVIAGVLARGSADDALVTRDGRGLAALASGARVGTGSRRRSAQLLALRSDLRPVALRGPVDGRVRQVDDGSMDAAILAVAGLERLGLAGRIAERFSVDEFVPEAGQGAIALVARVDDEPARALCASVEDASTRAHVDIERTLAAAIERHDATCAGDHLAAAHVDGVGTYRLRARAIDRSSNSMRTTTCRGADPDALVSGALEALLGAGAHREAPPMEAVP